MQHGTLVAVGVVVGYIGFVDATKVTTQNWNTFDEGNDPVPALLELVAHDVLDAGCVEHVQHLTTMYTLNACGPPPVLGRKATPWGAFALSILRVGDTVLLAARNRKVLSFTAIIIRRCC